MKILANPTILGSSDFVHLDRALRDIPLGENLTDEIDLQRRINSGASSSWAVLSSEMRVDASNARMGRLKYYDVFGAGGCHSAFVTTYAFGTPAFEDTPFPRLR